MTPDSTPTPAPPVRPYVSPTLVPLGTVEAVTAGPNEGGGNLDQLFGGTGGFNVAADGTS